MSNVFGSVALEGDLAISVTRKPTPRVQRAPLSWRIRNYVRGLVGGEWLVPYVARLATCLPGICVMYGKLSAVVTKADGTIIDYGVLGYRTITTAGKNYIAADIAGGANDSNLFKYHGVGTSSTAPAVGDTALGAESTTALNPDSTRATGSQSSSTNTYTTAGTLTADASIAAVEWGLFTQSATGGGTMLDRQTYSTVNLASGDSITFTYTLTIS